MRIKLSKQNWRLVGQKMGWLKRAQVAGNAAGVMGLGKDKITPGSLGQDTGNVNIPGVRTDKPLAGDNVWEQFEGHFDNMPKVNRPYRSNIDLKRKFPEEMERDLREIMDRNTDLQQYYLRSENPNWGALARDFSQDGTPSYEKGKRAIYNDYELNGGEYGKRHAESPAQLKEFEKEFNKQYSILTATRQLVLQAFGKWWSSQPQIQNNEGLDFGNGDVKL